MEVLTQSIVRSQKSTRKHNNFEFSALEELPRLNCFIASARDKATGKTHLFLVFKDKKVSK